MLVKSQVKYIQNLGHKKFRDADGVFVAEGPKIVNELLASDNLRLVQCFATKSWLLMQEAFVKDAEGLFFEIDEKELVRISFHGSPNQVLAIFTKPVFNQEPTLKGLTLLLDTIQDPGNLGTIIRTADWFGLSRVICSPETVDVFNQKVVQAAMGSIIRVEVKYTELAGFIKQNPEKTVYASVLDGEDLHEKIGANDALLVIGNESKGISSSLESLATRKIRIPRAGGAESLNVAVATGILLSYLEPFR
ncbi:MAG TPA: RNA methyltransferase [Puia sp.]|jgi:TrmH family RNA methyltransferase